MASKQVTHVLTVDDRQFMEGRRSLVTTVFNRISGATDDTAAEHASYLATIGPALAGEEFTAGQVVRLLQFGIVVASYKIGGPRGKRVEEHDLFEKWLGAVSREAGVEEDFVPDGDLLASFRAGLAPCDGLDKSREGA